MQFMRKNGHLQERYDGVNKEPKYDNVKISVSRKAKSLGAEKNPEDSSKIVFSEDVLHLANNSSFLRNDRTEGDPGEIILFVTGVRL